MEKDKKVTALYCRLSKDDGSNSESLSIRTQKSMLMEYATRNGFGNCQYYVDDGYSGTNSDRPAFQELLDDIREGKVATVITKDQSRLGRNHIETGTYMEIFFPEHGVRYIAINDGYDSNEQSQMDIAPFRNIINEMYAKDTSRKIKSALRTRKKSGKYISSGAPFGYQKDPADHNHLVIDPNTAPVVEYIYSMAEEGLGLHRIAKRLHDEKVLKPCYYKKEMFGRFIDDEKMYDWDSAYISQVLHSPVYAGHIIYEAKPTVSMKSKKRRYIPFEERAIVPNSYSIHVLLILYPVLLLAGGFRPQVHHIRWVLAFLCAIATPIFFLNRLLKTNFFFLNDPQGNAITAFFAHCFGERFYLLGFLPVLAAVLLLLYLPWYRAERHQRMLCARDQVIA